MPFKKRPAGVGRRRVAGGKVPEDVVEVFPGLEPGEGLPQDMLVPVEEDVGDVRPIRGPPPVHLVGEKVLPFGFQHERQSPVKVEMHEKAETDHVLDGREDMPSRVIPEPAGAVPLQRTHRCAVFEGQGLLVVAPEHVMGDRLLLAFLPPDASLPFSDVRVHLKGSYDRVKIVAKLPVGCHLLSPFLLSGRGSQMSNFLLIVYYSCRFREDSLYRRGDPLACLRARPDEIDDPGVEAYAGAEVPEGFQWTLQRFRHPA
ncbi:MAG: hypothetical protein A4E60_01730 [Syntrophorhabdus sp. PtaB.Bin047]|nr:MAG: hypothetical protein A4E60_01730 [Syntrophorhabdus sp. PtaB.Bin047]